MDRTCCATFLALSFWNILTLFPSLHDEGVGFVKLGIHLSVKCQVQSVLGSPFCAFNLGVLLFWGQTLSTLV